MSDVTTRIQWLRETILRADRCYYVEARPELTDAQYDHYWEELHQLELAHPELLTPDSPTQRVSGEPLSEFKKVRHHPPMRSLDKTYERGDLMAFDSFLKMQLGPDAVWDYIVEPKVDGLSLSLLYKNGRLVRAATRGNGEIGDDITANVRTIRSIPLTLPIDAPVVEIRGEIYMSRKGFAELNRQEEEAGHEPFANPRNAAAGSIKLLDPREVAQRPLDAVLYAAGVLEGVAFATHSEMMRAFATWGLKTPPWQRLCMDMSQVMMAIDELERQRHNFDFEMDGAVIKVNQRDLYAQLGSTAHAPRSARAYKYAPEHVQTRLRDITVQVGRTGVLTPVAELEPVALAGSTIARATLHNEDYIRQKDILVGDHVWLAKAGDVIPAIECSIPELRDGTESAFHLPTACPVCGGEVVRIEGEVATRCVNPACPAQRAGHLVHFVERNALDIAALGTRMAEALVASDLVKEPMDLYKLSESTLAEFRVPAEDGTDRKFGRRAKEVIDALERAKTFPLDRWIYALGISGIGTTAARVIARAFPNFEALRTSSLLSDIEHYYALVQRKRSTIPDMDVYRGELISLGDRFVEQKFARRVEDKGSVPKYSLDIKPEMVASMARFLKSSYAQRFFDALTAFQIAPQQRNEMVKGTALAGVTFVLTGALSQPREYFEAQIRNQGGVVQKEVSKKTRYLLVGDQPGGTKYNKALALGTPQLTEADFFALLEGTDQSQVGVPTSNDVPTPIETATATEAPKTETPSNPDVQWVQPSFLDDLL